jgi:hypothetical protein
VLLELSRASVARVSSLVARANIDGGRKALMSERSRALFGCLRPPGILPASGRRARRLAPSLLLLPPRALPLAVWLSAWLGGAVGNAHHAATHAQGKPFLNLL